MAGTISGFSSAAPPASGPTSGAGNAGKPPTSSVLDTFRDLQEMQWGGVSFPITETELEIRYDLVVHRMYDRNGAYIENTGRHPVQFSAEIPFINFIYPSASESWAAGDLYPGQWRRFMRVALEGTTLNLQHPDPAVGVITCKLDSSRTTWRGTVQGGVIVRASWLESDDTLADQVGENFSDPNGISVLLASSSNLDANIATLEAAVSAQQNPLPPLTTDLFTTLANAAAGVFDATTVLQKQVQGSYANLLYEAQRVEDSIDRSPISALLWPFFNDAERVKDAAYVALATPAITTRTIRQTTLLKPSTVAQAANSVGSLIDDFLVLNSALVGLPVIPAGTLIRYYAAAA